MLVLILTNNINGLYCFRMEVIKTLREEGHDIVISAPSDNKIKYFEEIGCRMINININRRGTNPIKDIGLMLRYRKLIKKIKPNVVLSYTIKPNIYGGIVCRMCNIPQIVNITGLGSAVENPGWLQKLTIVLYKISLRKVHTVFLQNKANMEFCEMHKMVKGKKILIPGSGVNLIHHSFQDYPAEGKLKFIFISRLLKEKGIEEYFGAAYRIKKLYPDTEFHVLGTCEDSYGELLQKLQDECVVIYHGQQPDVRPYIGMSHCTVHPSYYPEGMSNVLLESCAAGRPIITTNRPGCGEIVEDGRDGYVVKEKDVDDLVAVIERFIQLPYEQKIKLGQYARKKVEREFDRQIVVEAYLKEINSIGK